MRRNGEGFARQDNFADQSSGSRFTQDRGRNDAAGLFVDYGQKRRVAIDAQPIQFQAPAANDGDVESKYKGKYEQMRADFRKYKVETEATLDKVEAVTQENEALKATNVRLEAKVAEQAAEIASLQGNVPGLPRRFVSNSARSADGEALEMLRKENSELKAEVEILKTKCSSFEAAAKVQGQQQRHFNFTDNAELEKLRAEKSELELQVNKLKDECEDKKDLISDLQNRMAKKNDAKGSDVFDKEKDRLRQEKSDLNAKIRQLESEAARATIPLSRCDSTISSTGSIGLGRKHMVIKAAYEAKLAEKNELIRRLEATCAEFENGLDAWLREIESA